MNEQVRLAIVRTDLANQRTVLAYLRTSLAFFIATAGLPKLYSGVIVLVICGLLGLLGLGFAVAGIRVHRSYQRKRDRATSLHDRIY